MMLSFLGDLASLAGVAISIIGFGVTIWNVWKTGRDVREGLARVTSQVAINEVSVLLQVVRIVDSPCRDRLWASALERCDEARTHLGRLATNRRLTEEEKAVLLEAPDHLQELMSAVQKLRRSDHPKDLPSGHLDRLHALIVALSQTLGRLQNQALEQRHGD